jgi:hypothetical protein
MSETLNPYSIPQADIQADKLLLQDTPRFYVVSPTKFLILMIVTVGIYAVYWFYKNWQNYKIKTSQSMWPIARGIFSIFFAHSLFKEVDKTLMTNNIVHNWKPGFLATLYVIFELVSNISDRLSMNGVGLPLTDFLFFPCLAIITYALYQAQLSINKACLDPQGMSNSRFTAPNYFWIVFGVGLWLLIIIGSFGNLIGI